MSEIYSIPASAAPVRKPRKPKIHPNRIHALTKERRWTYAEVAERLRRLAEDRGDDAHAKVHEVTINKLAIGKMALTQEWMNLLGDVFSVPAAEIISVPIAQNLRRVRVSCALEGGRWQAITDLPENEQFDIMIPNDEALQAAELYAGEIRGPANNLRYSPQSIAVISKITQAPGEIVVGKRYHVRVMRSDGMIEDSIKLLFQDDDGVYWLRPESNHPEHQVWTPLHGNETLRVEIVGRVRGVFFRED